jgi:hypothetical protein
VTSMAKDAEQVGQMSADDVERIRNVLGSITRKQPGSFDARHYADVWIAEHRMTSEREATGRLTRATWVLVGTTFVLAVATFVLAYVTAIHHGG